MRLTQCDFCAVRRFKHTNFTAINRESTIVSHLCNVAKLIRLIMRFSARFPGAPSRTRHATTFGFVESRKLVFLVFGKARPATSGDWP